MADDFNFQTDYAASGRSTCKGCKDLIAQGAFRVGRLVQSPHFDGKIPMWFHASCFLKRKGQIQSVTDVKGFDKLRWDDQEKLRVHTGESAGAASAAAVAVSNADPDPPAAAPKAAAAKGARGRKRTATDEAPSAKRVEAAPMSEADRAALAAREQNKRLWEIKDKLQANCTTRELRDMLEENELDSTGGEGKLIERCADGMLFGLVPKCPTCKNRALVFADGMYRCHGDLSAWSKCTFTAPAESVKRLRWKVPASTDNAFLAEFRANSRNVALEKPIVVAVVKRVFGGAVFAFMNNSTFSVDLDKLKQLVTDNGGQASATLTARVTYVVAEDADAPTSKAQLTTAKRNHSIVVKEAFIHDSISANELKDAKAYALFSTYVAPVEKKEKKEPKAPAAASQDSAPAKQRLVKKGHAVVDADSGLENAAHVLEEGKTIYSVMLNMADIARGTNSYYAIQLLEHDNKPKFYLFYKWGRVGTDIGSNKTESFDSKSEAKRAFEDKYLDKTGNAWSARGNFVKQPNRFFPVDVDFGDDDDDTLAQASTLDSVKSALPKETYDLVSLIFDIDVMTKAMVELEVDLEKMPLGKLSKQHIDRGFGVLSELAKAIDSKAKNRAARLLDLSNQFYTIIPHNFGASAPPVIDNETLLKEKNDMLETLRDIEIASKLIKESKAASKAAGSGAAPVHPVDQKYLTLKTDLQPVPHASTEFKQIVEYIRNTHAKTHDRYSLELLDLFKVKREGERERFTKFETLHNRRLLWHGSRLTNFVGILSQGLRIAPPEAPVTGYMFGKGVYFADMVSKSANYCFTSPGSNVGLMLLSEVALGDMYELTGAKYMEKAPAPYHSTFGKGRTAPDPKGSVTRADGVEIPMGKAASVPINSSLLYNEFIVYDVAQINVQYLLKLRFNYRY